MKKLLIASKNPAKVAEYKLMLSDLPVELVSLEDLNIIEETAEDEKTFRENAIQKVEFYANLVKLPTIGDDGGLEIDYLHGEPGVKSRRWAGYKMTDQEMIDLALKKLKGVSKEKRGAQLRGVIAFYLPKRNKIYTFEAKIRGTITEKPSPILIKGYPFRSIFYLPGKGKIFSEIPDKELKEYSHRAKALEKTKPYLEKIFREE